MIIKKEGDHEKVVGHSDSKEKAIGSVRARYMHEGEALRRLSKGDWKP